MATKDLLRMLAPQMSAVARDEELCFMNDYLIGLFNYKTPHTLAKAYGAKIPLLSFGHETLYADGECGFAVEWINGDQTDRKYQPVENAANVMVYGDDDMKSVLAHMLKLRTPEMTQVKLAEAVALAFINTEKTLEKRLAEFKEARRLSF